MSDYFLSAHASVNARHLIAVPDGCTVYFYVPRGQILNHNRAFQIFYNLAQGITPGGAVNHTYTGGNMIPNYAIWNLSEYPEYSGVFWVGSDHASIHLTQYTEQNPLTLAQLFDFRTLNTPRSLYWVACA